MKPRCDGNRPGTYLSGFQCCLDADHDGKCRPYQPPTVDEWRAMQRREQMARAQGWHDGFKAGLARPADGASDGDGFDLDAQVIAGVQREREG